MPEKFLVDYYKSYAGANGYGAAAIQKDDYIRIVVFEDTPTGLNFNGAGGISASLLAKLSSKSTKEVSVLVVKEPSSQNKGTIQFFSKASTGWVIKPDPPNPGTFEYLKEEMLLGAIFTDSNEQYQCIRGNMLNKLKLVADIHDKRRDLLGIKTFPPNPPAQQHLDSCNPIYGNTLPPYPTQTNFNTLKSASPSNFNDLSDAAYGPTGLSVINKNLEKLSCPLLY